jgi:Uma2 family endonuclease
MTIAATAPPKVSAVLPQPKIVHYPETDGKPMAETDKHRREMNATIEALTDYFRNTPNVYVAGNLLLYYEEGNPSASVAPDVFVVKGVPKGDRRTYKLWEEGKAPNVVIEITSRSTRSEDVGVKRGIYAMLGVTEYFLYDPLEEYLEPALQGFRLIDGGYVRITPDVPGELHSRVLGLDVQIVDDELRLFDPHTGKVLLTPTEAQEAARIEAAARHAAEAKVQAEATARRAAEAEADRLRAELKKWRGE